MAVLAEYNTITEAEISKSMLDERRNLVHDPQRIHVSIYPIGTMPAQLVVKEEDAKRAAELLDKMP